MLGVMKEGIVAKMESIVMPLYKSAGSPHLEYGAQGLALHPPKGVSHLSINRLARGLQTGCPSERTNRS